MASGGDAVWAGLPLDDAWIHLVYGRSLLDHGLPYYNPGQLEAGWTSPLQVGVSAVVVAVSRWGAPVALMAKLASLAASIPGTVLAARIAGRRGGQVAAYTAAALVALSPTVAFAQLSGMEVGLCSSLLLYAVDREDRNLDPGWATAFAILARPECILLLPLLAIRGRWRSAAPSALVLGAWAACDYTITGRLLPPTFYAKAQVAEFGNLLLAGRALASAWPGLVWGAPLWAFALARSYRTKSWQDIAYFTFPVAFVAAVALGRHVSPDADYFYFLRYFLPVEALIAVAVAVGVSQLAQRFRTSGLAIAALLVVAGLPAVASRRDLYARQCQNIEEMQGVIADYLAQNASPDAGVATIDAGVIRYRSGLRTRDLVGLNDHAVLADTALRKRLLNDPDALAAWMDQNGLLWLVTFPLVIPHAASARHPERLFEIVLDRTSEDYRVAPADQGFMVLARRRSPAELPLAPAVELPSAPAAELPLAPPAERRSVPPPTELPPAQPPG